MHSNFKNRLKIQVYFNVQYVWFFAHDRPKLNAMITVMDQH